MSISIDFLTFKNILNKNNILLFDSQLRIAHFRYNNLIKTLPQTGGSGIKNPGELLKTIIQKNNCLLSHFIDSLITNNLIKIKYIVSYVS